MVDLGKALRRGDTSTDRVGDPAVIERVQKLTWALLDEQITNDEMSLLDSLLLNDGQARKCYIECVQLHCLTANSVTPVTQTTPKGTTTSPVLGFLKAGMLHRNLLKSPPRQRVRGEGERV